jgi:hypothetical protein
MSIRQSQIARTIENIVKYYMFHGRYPTMQTITYHFSQWLRENTPGTPSFSPLKFMRKEKSDADRYNQNIKLIHTDIQDAYDATIDQTIRVMSDFNFAETERKKIRKELADVSKKIDKLILLSKDPSGLTDSIIEDFSDMSMVDNTKSTIYTNVDLREITLKENIRQSNKVLLVGSNAKFSTLTPNVKEAAIESINNAFDDNMNSAWWHVIKTEGPGTVRGELAVLLPQESDINTVEFTSHSGKAILIELEYTTDGVNYTPLPGQNNQQSITDKASWNFPLMTVKGIKFIFEKKEYDDNSAGIYNYYFGAKNISVYKKNYLSNGELYTTPFVFNTDNVNMVSMIATHEIPYNTGIDYKVALYGENQDPNSLVWYPISSADDTNPTAPKIVEFNTRSTKTIEFANAETNLQVINGMTVFRLLSSNNNPALPDSFADIKNPQLLRGINQWKRERTYIKFMGDIPLNSNWDDMLQNRPSQVRVDYLPISNILSLRRLNGGPTDNFYRFTTCIKSDQAKVETVSIAMLQTVNGVKTRMGTYAVYMNGERMIPSNEDVTLKFKKGWNQIQILYHWGNMAQRMDYTQDQLPIETSLGKFNFSLETMVRADLEPLKYVDQHSLYYNISPNDHDNFAIMEQQVVLNYLPVNCIFQLSYELPNVNVKSNQVLLYANFSRNTDTPHLTPKLHGLQVQSK